MWRKSENNSNIRPERVKFSGNYVILRKNYVLIPASEDRPQHYEYDEWQMTKEQYEVYKNFEEKLSEQDDALIELAGLISEVMG